MDEDEEQFDVGFDLQLEGNAEIAASPTDGMTFELLRRPNGLSFVELDAAETRVLHGALGDLLDAGNGLVEIRPAYGGMLTLVYRRGALLVDVVDCQSGKRLSVVVSGAKVSELELGLTAVAFRANVDLEPQPEDERVAVRGLRPVRPVDDEAPEAAAPAAPEAGAPEAGAPATAAPAPSWPSPTRAAAWTSPSLSTVSGELTGLPSAIDYARRLARSLDELAANRTLLPPEEELGPEALEAVRAHLVAHQVTGEAVEQVLRGQETVNDAVAALHAALQNVENAAHAATRLATTLEGHLPVRDAYEATGGDAGADWFVQGD